MGTDIHTFLEVYKNDKWEYAGETERACDGSPWLKSFWNKQLYWTFARLTGVTGHWIPPIALPKGLPKDISADVQRQYNNELGHSCTFLMFKELIPKLREDVIITAFFTNEFVKTIETKGWLYLRWLEFLDTKQKLPKNIKSIHWHWWESFKLLDGRNAMQNYKKYTLNVPWYNVVDETLVALLEKEAKKHKNLNNVRLIIWFDS